MKVGRGKVKFGPGRVTFRLGKVKFGPGRVKLGLGK